MINEFCIMLITPMEFPIPAVGGGAIESLITDLLDINEIEKKAKIVVISTYDEDAKRITYNNSCVYYFKNNTCIEKSHGTMILWWIYRILRKILNSRLAKCFIKREFYAMDYFVFQCYRIAKKEHVNCVINEGRNDEFAWQAFNNLVGNDNFYNHIHFNRKANIQARGIINNSISISNYVKNVWCANSTIKGKDYVLYNGIDVDKFSIDMSPEIRRNKRHELGFSDTDTVVIFCGRLIAGKGIKELLDALDLLQEYPIKLLLIGSASFSKGNQTEFSVNIVKRAKEMNNVKYMGYIDNSEMPQYYALSDIMVVPSICQEGAGLVAVEGMASGLPLIVTKSGGMTEYVDDKTSIQVPIDENLSDNLAQKIIELSENNEKRKNMITAGRQRAMLFTKKKYYMDFINIVNGMRT